MTVSDPRPTWQDPQRSFTASPAFRLLVTCGLATGAVLLLSLLR